MTGNNSEVKIGFVTCVQLGKSCIEEIVRIGGRLHLIITLPDDYLTEKSGRVFLDEIAKKEGIPLLKVRSINQQNAVEAIKEKRIDWLFIIGWSQIAGKELLEAVNKGCIGMHPTLLPEGRGRAAIPWAIIKGLEKTGVTMFKLDQGVDTGEIIGQEVVLIDNETDASMLYEKIERAHVNLIRSHWNEIINNRVRLTKQNESLSSVWPGRKPKDGEILPSMTMEEAGRLVRAVTKPYPGAFIIQGNIKTTIWKAVVNSEEGMYKLTDGFITPIEYEVAYKNDIKK